MRKAFITTVFNEENNITDLLDGLRVQTVKPDEIILVDGGSTDLTLKLIKDYSIEFPKLKLKVYKKKGNRSKGRNFAINKSTSDIIAATDAGCLIDKNWFEKITKPYDNKSIDVVAGFYKPITNNIFEKCLAAYTCVPPNKVTEDFLPSSRSIAFTKKAWKSVGGYPEELDFCEDLVFAKRLKQKGFTFFVEKKAFVLWPQRKNLMDAAIQFYNYAIGDGRAGYFRPQTPLLFGRFILGGVLLLNGYYYLLLVLFLLYIFWAILKNFRYAKHPLALIFLPMLQIISDFTVFIGTILGVLKRFQ